MSDSKPYTSMTKEELRATGKEFWNKIYAVMTPEEQGSFDVIALRMGIVLEDEHVSLASVSRMEEISRLTDSLVSDRIRAERSQATAVRG